MRLLFACVLALALCLARALRFLSLDFDAAPLLPQHMTCGGDILIFACINTVVGGKSLACPIYTIDFLFSVILD
jgi:hypothetical protein